MKKLLTFLLAFALLAVGNVAKAQYGSATQVNTAAGDTLAGALDTVVKILPVTVGVNSLGIQVNLTKTAGTLGGKAYLYRSVDNGATYQIYDSASYVATLTTSFNVPTVTHTAQFEHTAPAGSRYEVWATSGSSSLTAAVQVWYTSRKYSQF